MTWKELLGNGWFVRVVLVLWLVSAVFVLLLLGQIDWIVHNELYGYGLQFNLDWAVPYWGVLRAIYLFLAVPVAFSIVYFGLEVLRFLSGRRRNAVERKPVKSVKPVSRGVKAAEQNHMVISCPKCHRVFSKPLVMLDFSGGKTRLVNVCPYCNHVLGWEGEEAKKENIRVVNLDEEKAEH